MQKASEIHGEQKDLRGGEREDNEKTKCKKAARSMQRREGGRREERRNIKKGRMQRAVKLQREREGEREGNEKAECEEGGGFM